MHFFLLLSAKIVKLTKLANRIIEMSKFNLIYLIGVLIFSKSLLAIENLGFKEKALGNNRYLLTLDENDQRKCQHQFYKIYYSAVVCEKANFK